MSRTLPENSKPTWLFYFSSSKDSNSTQRFYYRRQWALRNEKGLNILGYTLVIILSFFCVRVCSVLVYHGYNRVNIITWWMETQLNILLCCKRSNITLFLTDQSAGFKIYSFCIPSNEVRLHPLKKGCFWYDTKLHLMVRLQFWRSGEWGVLQYHCSQVHSVPE